MWVKSNVTTKYYRVLSLGVIDKKDYKWHSPELFNIDDREGRFGDTIYKICNLEEFYNQESTEKILADLSIFATKNGFKLEKIDL